jgi:hypothetical protein
MVDCGGAYIKLLTDGSLKDLSLFNDKTPYTIMFGPDKCGGVSKVRYISCSSVLFGLKLCNQTLFSGRCTSLFDIRIQLVER